MENPKEPIKVKGYMGDTDLWNPRTKSHPDIK